MISTRYDMNSMLRLTALNLIGMFSLAVTLCVTFPFFLVIVSLGTVGAGADALGNRWNKGRKKHSVGMGKCSTDVLNTGNLTAEMPMKRTNSGEKKQL